MRTEVITADSIDAAVERILNQLKEDIITRGTGRGENVIYFDGWDGLCASAVLRTVAVEAPAALQFDQVVHVDCSNWVNKRALQRSIAEHLDLPPLVMDMFNIQDEEDDFNGVPLDTRDAVLPVREAMLSQWEQMLNRKFLVIFINGSDEEIDLASVCDLPLYGYSRNTVLWTFQGRFRLKPRAKVDRSIKRTDVVLSATHDEKDPRELWSYLVLQEAVDLRIAARSSNAFHDGPGGIIDHQPAQIAECFLYMWKLCGMVHNLRMDYDLAISNLPPRASRDITVPDMMCRKARILHVHDSKSIPYVPGPLEGSTWRYLRWCRVERCPGLDCVFFVCPQAASDWPLFYYLETLWCSQLPRVRCIWNFSGSSLTQRFDSESFEDMVLVHVDLCPRLTHVLPLWADGLIDCSFQRSLETLEIVWCGDIRAVFPFDNTEADQSREEDEQQEATTPVEFPSLKHIHLHELPKLLGMCGRRRIYAPNLESIKVRGCWSLTRLPAVGNGDYNNKVNCDCEKEWWNNLKWDGKNHRSLYKPMHPRHNKKTLLRSSVLR